MPFNISLDLNLSVTCWSHPHRYIADEPDGAHWNPNITAKVYEAVKAADTVGNRPVALCLDTTIDIPGSWEAYLPYTDIIMPDIYPLPAKPSPPPPPPGECAKCPKEKPYTYGSTTGGTFCCEWPAVRGDCAPPLLVSVPVDRHSTPNCCLDPGTLKGCQGVTRCDTNPGNHTPCDLRPDGVRRISWALDRVRAVSDKPIIFIAQAFGGGEGYPRAPTVAEERVMTYIAWIHGSQGVMYFAMDYSAGGGGLRDQPPNLRAECERLGFEGSELTPALASGTNNTHAPHVTVSDPRIEAGAFVEARLGGGIVILVANTATQPVQVTLTLTPGVVKDGVATVLFANRNVTVAGGVLHDWVDAMGTRAYRLTPVGAGRTARAEPNPKNLLFNPSFESAANAEFPDAYSVMVGADKEAATFLDSRDSIHGLHSLRLHTPADGAGLQVTAYLLWSNAS
jgi:hypothetical protein